MILKLTCYHELHVPAGEGKTSTPNTPKPGIVRSMASAATSLL